MSGTIIVPEVAHDTEEDEYVVSLPISPTSPTASTTPIASRALSSC